MAEYTMSIWKHDSKEFMQDVGQHGSNIVVREVWRTKNLTGYSLIFNDDQDLVFFKLKYPKLKSLVQVDGFWRLQNA